MSYILQMYIQTLSANVLFHYKGGADVVALYLRNNPKSRIFDGRALILGGSHAPNYDTKDSLVGDLSAILIENISPAVNFFRIDVKNKSMRRAQ